MNRPTIILQFCKWPTVGHVKTRLAIDIGPESACELYQWMAERCFREMQQLGTESKLILYYTGAEESKFQYWLPGSDAYWPQPETGLGERISQGMEKAFSELDPAAVIAVGTDCPALDTTAMRKMIEALSSHDSAIIPAQDGGYAAIGLARYIPELFKQIDWSTERVFNQTIERCKSANLTTWVGEPVNDIDTLSDWESVMHQYPEAPIIKQLNQ